MKQNKLFYVIGTMIAMLIIVTGCQKQNSNIDNSIYKVSDSFVNGYGSNYFCVYVQNDEGLFVIADATEESAREKYLVGFDGKKNDATGIYLPLKWEDEKVSALLSYGDAAPVVLSKKKDKLYSTEARACLTFRPAEYTEYTDYALAMEKYGQSWEGTFENIGGCRCYEVSEKEISVYPLGTSSNGGTIYNIKDLKPGLYFVNDTYGIVEIVK